ncbi:MAG: hypothetical protein KKB59_18280 [Spirochaetes bacterium]|nr:hypothetical protein [Spirochaetota bacterium]
MVGLPKAIIKKYGVTKKAWQVFRGQKKKTHRKANKPKRSNRSPVRHMVRRRYSRRSKPRRSSGYSIGIATSLAALTVPLNILTRQGGHGQPVYEAQTGNWNNALQGVVDNTKWAVTSFDGIVSTFLPIIGVSFIKKFVPNSTIIKIGRFNIKAL